MWTDQEHMHVQDLRYLNVAMNRISRCENLQGCESLEKLDMTLNKIGIAELPSLSALRANLALRRLYLLGNPCTTWPDHRQYVIATLPQIDHLVSEQVISIMHTTLLIPLRLQVSFSMHRMAAISCGLSEFLQSGTCHSCLNTCSRIRTTLSHPHP